MICDNCHKKYGVFRVRVRHKFMDDSKMRETLNRLVRFNSVDDINYYSYLLYSTKYNAI
jgi:hypothetical protein